jgi:hypothetical protein
VSVNGAYDSGLYSLVKPPCIFYSYDMNPQQLVAKYGSQVAVAKAFGVTRAAVQLWVRQGKVPQARLWQHKAGLVKPPQGR